MNKEKNLEKRIPTGKFLEALGKGSIKRIRKFDAKATKATKEFAINSFKGTAKSGKVGLVYYFGTPKEVKKTFGDKVRFPNWEISEMVVGCGTLIAGLIATGVYGPVILGSYLFSGGYMALDGAIRGIALTNSKNKRMTAGLIGLIRAGTYQVGKATIQAPGNLKNYVKKVAFDEIESRENLRLKKKTFNELYKNNPEKFINYVDGLNEKVQKEVVRKALAIPPKKRNLIIDAHLSEKYSHFITTQGRDNIVK